MNMELPHLGIGIAGIILLVALAIWYLAVSMRSDTARRDHEETKRLADQPWDSADGRANK